MSSFTWPGSSPGVSVYPTFADFPPNPAEGSLVLAEDTGILYIFDNGSYHVVGGTSTPITVGPLDGQPPSADGGTIASNALFFQSASATFPGLVNNTTQSFSGNKTFTGTISASNLSGTNTGDVTLGTANGLSLVGQVLSLALSSTSTTGALSSTDWNTFNSKQSALSFTAPLVNTSGTVSITQSGTASNGYLSATDWNTFNNKQAAGNYITDLTGDGTATGPGSAVFTLATVMASPNNYGQANAVGAFTVNGKGLITAASNLSIQISESQVTNLVSDLAGKQPVGNYITALTGDVTATGPGSVAASLVATTNSTLTTLSVLALPASQLTGSVSIAHGGTGQSSKTAAFDALSPTTTKGDLIVSDGTNNVREPVGTDGFILTADSGQPSGVSWQPVTATSQDYFISAAEMVDGGLSGNTFTSFNNAPILTFSPTNSGTYRIYATLPMYSTGTADPCSVKIQVTSGSPTVIFEQESPWSQAVGGNPEVTYVYAIYTLTASTSYTFTIYGKQINGGQVLTMGNSIPTSGTVVVAERIA